MGLLIDAFVLPVPTFRRIGMHPVAVSIFWASIVFLAVSGVEIGTSIISDPFQGEEAARAAPAVSAPAPPLSDPGPSPRPLAPTRDAGALDEGSADPEE